MSEQTVDLHHGLKVGDKVHKTAVVREETVADMLAGVEGAEKLISTPEGYQLVSNASLAGLLALGQQIVKIGDVPGPFDKDMLAKLSSVDLDLIRDKAEALAQATLIELAARGRPDPSSQ